MRVIGADIGGTKVSVCLGDSDGNVLAFSRFPTASFPGPESTLAEVVRHARVLMRDASIGKVDRIGISCAGPLDSTSGMVLSPPNMPGWDVVPIVEFLTRELGAPARLENDANAAALAE